MFIWIQGIIIPFSAPQGNQLLVVRNKVGKPPGELGVSKSMECDIFPSVPLRRRERECNKLKGILEDWGMPGL